MRPAISPEATDAAASRLRGARAAWNWRTTTAAVEKPPPRSRLAVQGAIGILIGSFLLSRHHPYVGGLALTLSSLSLLLALVGHAAWIHAVQRGLDRFAKGVGKVTTVAVLTLVYVFFFIPVGILSRGKATARFQRNLDPKAYTYWRKRTAGSTQTERQF